MVPVAAAAALSCTACSEVPRSGVSSSVALAQAIDLGRRDPAAAARALARLDPVPGLERVRLDAWSSALEQSDAPSGSWMEFLEARPPAGAASAARVALGRSLAAEGMLDLATEHLTPAMADGSAEAALALMDVGGPAVRKRAARWLATHAPGRLSGDIEAGFVRTMTAEDRLLRAESLLEGSRPSRARIELRSWRSRGELEVARKRLLARSELAMGRPVAALAVLPSGRAAEPRDHLLRARAWRDRAWDRYPRRSAGPAFQRAMDEARRALGDTELEVVAESVRLEAALETGRLDAAWNSWRRLAALGWADQRRGWLGRRLGVALAIAGRTARVSKLGQELPQHRRCLSYWRASVRGDMGSLAALGDEPVTDVYAWWAGTAPASPGSNREPRPSLGAEDVPRLVGDLLERSGPEAARSVWWSVVDTRGVAPAEAAALGAFEAGHGRPVAAVAAVRRGFPHVGTGRLHRVPRDVLELYLPLRWKGELLRAARSADLDPWLLAGQVRQESLFRPEARSPKGAVGLLQLLPSTAAQRGRALGVRTRIDLTDPALNLRLGAAEMADLLEEFGELEFALAAYNAGPRRVRGWRDRWPDPKLFMEMIPIPETYWYVRRVLFLGQAYRWLYSDAWGDVG